MIDPLTYIASDHDLCVYCFKNKPPDVSKLMEFTINCGLCFIETGIPVKEPVFNPWEYIASYPESKKCFWKNNTLDVPEATLAWIYYGTENKLQRNKFDIHKPYFSNVEDPAKWYLSNINFPEFDVPRPINLKPPHEKLKIQNIWYINLDHRADRNDKVTNELTKAKCPYFNRFRAINARQYPSASAVSICNGGGAINGNIKSNIGTDWILGHYDSDESFESDLRVKAKTACTMSHFHLWKKTAMYEDGWVVILEDDFRCNYTWDTFLDMFTNNLKDNPDADVIIFSNRTHIAGKKSAAGTDGYLLRVECAKRMWKYNEPSSKMFCSDYSLDNHFNSLRKAGWLKIYSFDAPFITNIDNGKSDIEIYTLDTEC